MKWRHTAALGLCMFLALILRVPDLDQRPFHNDEAVNAIKFRDLFEQGVYRYDPEEYHGPVLPYATRALAFVAGWPAFEQTSESGFRWLTVLFGAALIPLLWLTRDGLGRVGTLCAALLTALAPTLVFFSRDYIHETLLVAFTFGFIGSLWRYARAPGWPWAVTAGLVAGLMHATKETFVFNLGAMGAAAGILWLWAGFPPCAGRTARRRYFRHGLLMLGVSILVSMAFFSSFGHNPQGPLDSLRTYAPWFSRAGGESPHVHPWWFFAERLFWADSGRTLPWTEAGLLLFALVGLRAALTGKGLGDADAMFVRGLGVYTGLLFLIYSLLPYKTPWCILGVAHGLVLLAGVGLSVLWRRAGSLPFRAGLATLTLALFLHAGWQAWMLSHSNLPARDNPWAYADTSPDIRNLVERVETLAAVSSLGTAMNVQVVCAQGDYWPLPWSLRRYERVGWWSEPPPEPYARVLVVSQEFAPLFQENPDYWNAGTFQLRHGVFLSCYVQHALWEAFLESRESD